jgi:hypothetical protein
VQEVKQNRLSNALKVVLLCLVIGLGAFTGSATFYIRFHYAEVMPRSPQTETGRVFPLPAQYGGTIYVNKTELERQQFIEYTLTNASILLAVLYVFLGVRLRWWPTGRFPR